MIDIGLEIRILRERLKMSAKELAERVGLSQSQMSRLEKGQRRIDTQVLRRVAEALGVDPSYFFRGEETLAETDAIPPSTPPELGKVVRAERRNRHVSADELASRVGKPRAVIQSIEEGKREIDPELAQSIAKALRLPPTFFLGAQQRVIEGLRLQIVRLNEALAEASRGQLELGGVARQGTPVLGSVADGYPQRFDAAGRPALEATDFLYVPEVEQPESFALSVVGDSMESASAPSFREGDLLVLAPGALRSRDFAFVRLLDAQATFRQVFFEPAGQVRLQPLNLAYAAEVYPRQRVLATWRLVGHIARH